MSEGWNGSHGRTTDKKCPVTEAAEAFIREAEQLRDANRERKAKRANGHQST